MKKVFITTGPGCFILIIFLMFCDCQLSVALPFGTMGLPAVWN